MEKDYDVKTKLVKYLCDDCGEEVKHIDGNMLLTNPPKFKHKCISCDKEYMFTCKYPYVKYEYI